MKYIRLFETEASYHDEKETFEYPTVSYTEDSDIVWYMEKKTGLTLNLFDVVYIDNAQLKKVYYTDYDPSMGDILGICIIPSGEFDNGKARVMSVYSIDNSGNTFTDSSVSAYFGYQKSGACDDPWTPYSNENDGLINTNNMAENLISENTNLFFDTNGIDKYNEKFNNIQWYIPATNEANALTPIIDEFKTAYQACMGINVPSWNFGLSTLLPSQQVVYSYNISAVTVQARRLPVVLALVPFFQI